MIGKNPTIWRRIDKKKVIQSEEFIVKESQRYNVLVYINRKDDIKCRLIVYQHTSLILQHSISSFPI